MLTEKIQKRLKNVFVVESVDLEEGNSSVERWERNSCPRPLGKSQVSLRKGLEEEKYILLGKEQDYALGSELKRGSGRELEDSIHETQDSETETSSKQQRISTSKLTHFELQITSKSRILQGVGRSGTQALQRDLCKENLQEAT